MNYRVLKSLMGNSSLREIVKINLRERENECWVIELKMCRGEELRLTASTEEEAKAIAAQITQWREHPETIPAAPPLLSRRGRFMLFWLLFFSLLFALAVHGTISCSLVSGWAYTRHFAGGLFAACLTIILLFATAGAPGYRHPFQWGSLPLCILLVLLYTSAGKSINSLVGTQQRLDIEGTIISIDSESWDIKATRRTQITADLVVMQVADAATGLNYEIELPAWVAKREGVRPGAIWRDQFYRGFLGWLYRKGTVWDERAIRPGIVTNGNGNI